MKRNCSSLKWIFGSVALLGVLAMPALAQSSIDPQEVPYQIAPKPIFNTKNAKLLIDPSNLGGTELDMAELTFPAGTIVDAHTHGSTEIFYVLSGKLGHEVNGQYHLLGPGMVGIVRPGDKVRHIVPKEQPVRVLVIWTPSGEAARIFPTDKRPNSK